MSSKPLSPAAKMRYGFVQVLRTGIRAWTNPNERVLRRFGDPQEAAIDGALAAIDLAPGCAAMYVAISDEGTHRYVSPECAHGACDDCDRLCRKCQGACLCHCHPKPPSQKCATCHGAPPPGFACTDCGAGASTPEPPSGS